MRFDAQCDVASIVYGSDDDPDRLLIDFASDLSRSGFQPVGIVQSGHSCQSDNPPLSVVVLPTDRVVRLVSESFTGSTGCQLDVGRLSDLAKELACTIEAGADLVIVNRFGRLEAEGGGLIDLIAQALNADIPVLIVVSERRFSDWIRFCSGMSVRLACDREELNRWWLSVSATSHTTAAETFCEAAK